MMIRIYSEKCKRFTQILSKYYISVRFIYTHYTFLAFPNGILDKLTKIV